MGDQAVSGAPLIEGDQGLFLPRANDQIGLPVTKALAAVDALGAQLNGDLADDCAAPLAPGATRLARLLTAQGKMQLPTPTLVGVDALVTVDALGADGGLLVGAQVAQYLLRAPGQTELVIDDIPCALRDAWTVLAGKPSLLAQRLSLFRSIAAKPRVAGEFAANGRAVPIQQSGDVGLRVASATRHGNLVAFVLGEMCVVHQGNFDLSVGWLGRCHILPNPSSGALHFESESAAEKTTARHHVYRLTHSNLPGQ